MNVIFGLIELLFDNFFLLLILLGVFSVLRSKMQGGGRTGQRPQHRPMPPPPPFSGHSQPQRFPPEPQRAMQREPELQREPEQEVRRNAPEPSEPIQVRRPDVSAKPPARAVQQSSAQTRRALLHPQHAAQGLMWSEVLGPPRALQPHRAIVPRPHAMNKGPYQPSSSERQ